MKVEIKEDYFWRFYMNPEGLWGWCLAEYTGYIVRCSGDFFEKRADCVEDARQHGYLSTEDAATH